MVTICSGFSPNGYKVYGKNFLESFEKHWPEEVRLVVYTEDQKIPVSKQVANRSLWSVGTCRDFIRSHSDDRSNGRNPTKGWRAKEIKRGYNFRFDAVKFCRQMYIPGHAASFLSDGEILAWMDADIVTFKDVPPGFIESLIGGHELVFLGRDKQKGKSSELGFWAVRLNKNTRMFLANIADAYTNEYVFELPEWHSGYVFDHFRKGMDELNLTPEGGDHVWFDTPLGKYTDHLKGDLRKLKGISFQRTM